MTSFLRDDKACRSNQEIIIGLLSLGCARTLVDSEIVLGCLKKEGYKVSTKIGESNFAIVNTCGFIEDAKKESIETILELIELKKSQKLLGVVVLGCLPQRYGDELQKELPELDGVVGTNQYELLPRLVRDILEKHEKVFDYKATPRYLPGENTPRFGLTPPHYAYIKVSEGCTHACSYCVIPKMKGPHRSRSLQAILREVRQRAKTNRLSEINLVGQDTASYGLDLEKKLMLPLLLTELAKLRLSHWIRTLYLHPGHVSDELIEVMAKNPAICKYVDLPIEHSHEGVLQRMNRGITRHQIEKLIGKLRQSIPGVAIRTSIIVGFPGESKEEFEDLRTFLKEIRFDKLGAFRFSNEEGSRAFAMPGQIAEEVKNERLDEIMRLQQVISQEINETYVGKTLAVLIDSADDEENNTYYGRTQGDAPEVDGQVIVHSGLSLKAGDFVNVRIEDAMEYDLEGSYESFISL